MKDSNPQNEFLRLACLPITPTGRRKMLDSNQRGNSRHRQISNLLHYLSGNLPIWRKVEDSNPYGLATGGFQDRSTTICGYLPCFGGLGRNRTYGMQARRGYSPLRPQVRVQSDWWARQDSNLYLTHFEGAATTNCATRPKTQLSRYRKWSGRSDSNRRHPASEAGTLPTELRPEVVGRGSVFSIVGAQYQKNKEFTSA